MIRDNYFLYSSRSHLLTFVSLTTSLSLLTRWNCLEIFYNSSKNTPTEQCCVVEMDLTWSTKLDNREQRKKASYRLRFPLCPHLCTSFLLFIYNKQVAKNREYGTSRSPAQTESMKRRAISPTTQNERVHDQACGCLYRL